MKLWYLAAPPLARRLLRGCLLLVWMIAAAESAGGEGSKVRLWKGLGSDCNRTEIAFEAISCRVVDIDVQMLRPTTSSVEFRLEGRPPITVVRKRSVASPGGFVWDGRGPGRSRATFSVVDGSIVGDIISVDGKTFRLRQTSTKQLAVEFLDLSKLMRVEPQHRFRLPQQTPSPSRVPTPGPVEPPASQASGSDPGYMPPPTAVTPPASQASGAGAGSQTQTSCADDGSVIDVMVLYTPTSVVEAKSESTMKAQINKAEAVTNWAFDDSGVKAHIRVVSSTMIPYDHDTDQLNDILGVLTNPADLGANDADTLNSVHGLRSLARADIVVLIVSQPANANGLANPMVSPHVGVSFAPLAFAVIPFQGLSLPDGYVFAHELGHIMGSNHEDASDGAAPYSHGMSGRAVASCPGWGTIMAQPTCTNCQALGMWSTPLATFCGQPLGKAGSNDNVSSLNETRLIVAQFQCAIP